MKRFLLGLWLCVAVACEDYANPVEPIWHKQPCDHCHMLVSDPQFAAQLVTRSHERRYFDDPGCLASYVHAHADSVERAWVHRDAGWAVADATHYRAGASSPMGYGFIASDSGELDFAAMSRAALERAAGGAP